MIEQTGISDEKARAILQRAAEIDRRAADAISIETLRAAAQEAGIAESSFTAALSEHALGEERDRTARSGRRLVVGAFAGIGAVGVLLVGWALLTRLFP
jgi:hypothetical protein